MLRRADSGHNVLALRIDQVFAHRLGLAIRAVASERHAGPGIAAHVAEHHRADVHGRAEQAGDLVDRAIFLRAFRVPRAEHGVDRESQLLHRILRERLFHLLLVDPLVDFAKFLELAGGQVGILLRAILFFQPLHFDFVVFVRQAAGRAHDHIAEHIDKAAIAIPAGTLVPRGLDEAKNGFVGQAEVQDGVHHARHRYGGAGADGYQQRVVHVAELLAHHLLEFAELGFDLIPHPGRILPAMLAEISAGFR